MPVPRRGIQVLTMLAGIALAACRESDGGGTPGVRGGVSIAGQLSTAHCPGHDSVRIQVDQGIVAYDTIPLVGPNTQVPEYHDCQRFIDSTGGNYGPLVGIFAVSTLAGFEVTPATPARGIDFREGPETADPAAAAEPIAPAPPHAAGFPVGIIADFDRVPYAPLGILPGFNCLYIVPSTSGPHGLTAFVVPVGATPDQCATAYSPGMGGTELLVYTKRMPLDHPNDYPPVARWDWDPSTMTQYIGIPCGRRWCEIGRKSGFTKSPTHLFPIMDRKERRVFAVKGWHDDQWLARPGIGGLYPQPFRGTLVPVKNLADLTFGTTGWTDVARVSISPHDPVYESKFHLTTASMPSNMNRIALCQGRFTDCLAADPQAPPAAAPTCPAGSTTTWWARITNTKGQKFFHCVTRRAHVGLTMPGTARWLWDDDDELIWVECDEGCCQVHRGTEFSG